jgi:hypothetical protein
MTGTEVMAAAAAALVMMVAARLFSMCYDYAIKYNVSTC